MKNSFQKKIRPPKSQNSTPPPPPLFKLTQQQAGSPIIDPLKRFLAKSGSAEMNKILKNLTSSSTGKKDA